MFEKAFRHWVGMSKRAQHKLRAYFFSILLTLGAMPVAQAAEPVQVVASFSILGDMVKVIGADDVRLTTLIGPGADAHAFDPSPADIRTLANAQILVVNGLGFEAWMTKLTRAAGFKGTEIVASDGVAIHKLDVRHDHDHGGKGSHSGHKHAEKAHRKHDGQHGGKNAEDDLRDVDPHAWQSLENGVRYARNIAEGLAKADPDNAAQYRQRAERYVAEMTALHAQIKASFQVIPEQRRRVVIPHDSMGYFGRAYQITFYSAAGLSSDAEPSAKDIARLVRDIKANGSTALFTEGMSGGNQRVMAQVARETGLKVGGPLFTDSLDIEGRPAGDYLGMFRWNADQIISALQP